MHKALPRKRRLTERACGYGLRPQAADCAPGFVPVAVPHAVALIDSTGIASWRAVGGELLPRLR
jgi:hypothetical protein